MGLNEHLVLDANELLMAHKAKEGLWRKGSLFVWDVELHTQAGTRLSSPPCPDFSSVDKIQRWLKIAKGNVRPSMNSISFA